MRVAVVPELAVTLRLNPNRMLVRWAVAALLVVAAVALPRSGKANAAGEVQPAPAQAVPVSPEAPPSTAPAPATPAKSPDTAGTPATVIDGQQVESVLGRPVQSATGEDMGRIVDVIADKTGQARAVIIDFGGFFGVGSRKIAIDWHALHFSAEKKSDKVVVDLPLSQLRMAPVYKEGEPVVVLGASVGLPAGQAGSSPSAGPAPSAAP